MNGFKVNVNKRIGKIMKLMTPEIKKERSWSMRSTRDLLSYSKHEIYFVMLCAFNLFFSFKVAYVVNIKLGFMDWLSLKFGNTN